MNHDHDNEVIYFAKTNFRNQMTKFGIKTDDRRRHMYVIGKTGMGKTTLLENLILSDIYAGHGCCYVDPHGDTAEKIINYIPSWRLNDVVYFNPADLDYPVGFNILEAVSERHKHLVASGMMGVFAKIWENMWSSRMEYILNNTILALLDNQGQTMLGINRMMSDAEYRKRMVSNVKDPVVKQFWVTEFASWSEKYATEATAAIQNKIGQFLSASVIRNIVAQVKSTIHIRDIMDQNKIFIVNLSKGRVGEDNSKLIGGLLVTKIQLSAMERVDTPEDERDDFYLYVDEFQNFAVESFANILSEARKYRLCLLMAHQYIAQLTEEVRDAVFGNVGTMVVFRVGSPDATFMEAEFMPRFIPEDIINLPKYNIYLKLLIDGVTSMPFSAITLGPIAEVTNSQEKVIKISRERYASPREEIEEKIMLWSGMGEKSDETSYKESAEKKKANTGQSGGKPRHEYNCTRCDTQVVLPVELDRSRPIYCDDCITIVREEKKSGGRKPSIVKSAPRPKPEESSAEKVEERVEKPGGAGSGSAGKIVSEKKEVVVEKKEVVAERKETEVIEKPLADKPISLDVLKKEPVKEMRTRAEELVVQEKAPEIKKSEEVPVAKREDSKAGGYTCSDCGDSFEASVKLDRSRPMYCGKCLEKIRDERKKGDKDRKDFKRIEPVKTPEVKTEAPKKMTEPVEIKVETKRMEEKKTEDRGSTPSYLSGEEVKRKRKRKRKKPSDGDSRSRPSSSPPSRPNPSPQSISMETKPAASTLATPKPSSGDSGSLKSGQTIRFD
ncbi:MAG: type IV secretion system DNA-binding domain-containing protein [Parcubacteria group bacterium]|nr:type IV secretion system DNA-binding domain-containing protein [Parcubacteria group bacterium]